MAPTARTTACRLQLIEVARAVLVEDGLDGFVVRRIADRADVRLGNLQYYFPTRLDLLAAVVRHELATDLDGIDDTIDAEGGDHVAELRSFLSSLADRWQRGATDVYLAAGLLALHDDAIAAVIDEVWLAFYDVIAERVRRIDPTVSADEACARAMVITALFDGASLQRIDAAGVDRERFVARAIDQALAIARGESG